jgi:hypothetical protein
MSGSEGWLPLCEELQQSLGRLDPPGLRRPRTRSRGRCPHDPVRSLRVSGVAAEVTRLRQR